MAKPDWKLNILFFTLLLAALPACAQSTLPAVSDMVTKMSATPASPSQDGMMVPEEAKIPIAQQPFAESLPIEVSMMYSKLIKEEPNFDFLVFANPVFRNNPDKYADPEQIKVARNGLEKLYKSFNADTVFYAEKDVEVRMEADEGDVVHVRGIEPYEPIKYDLTDTEKYGVFIVNARETLNIEAPYEAKDLVALVSLPEKERKHLVAEITYKPLTVDRENFALESGEQVKVLVANIVELKLYNEDKTTLYFQKRFKGWKPPEPPKEDPLFKPDALIPAPPAP